MATETADSTVARCSTTRGPTSLESSWVSGASGCARRRICFFSPIAGGDAPPAAPPVIKLDGWSTTAQHNMFNGLKWGPDGWLWGCNGIMSNSRVGTPGTPDHQRVAIDCGVWRYHP